MSRDWNEFTRFEAADNKYLPFNGQGDNMATQIVTAVSKLVYKWYNDGDVFDNTAHLEGWANDLSSYANWLIKYCDEADQVISKWWFKKGVFNDSDYEDMLYELCEATQDVNLLAEKYEGKEKVGSIYKCDGPFKFVEQYDDDEDDDICGD